MPRGFLAITTLLALSLPMTAATAAAQAGVERMLNNEGLVVLARAGYNERFLVELIQTQPSRFDTSVEGLAVISTIGCKSRRLTAAGASLVRIATMVPNRIIWSLSLRT